MSIDAIEESDLGQAVASGAHVAVLGDGTMATTLANVLATGGRRCRLWCPTAPTVQSVNERRRHDKFFLEHELAASLTATVDLREAVEGAALVVSAVPSTSFRELARRLHPIVTPVQALFSATKGLDLPSLKRMSEVLCEETKAGAVGTISGPNITYEIMAGQRTGLVVASTSRRATALCARSLATPRLHVYSNEDLVGVELAGALKNVVAIAVGIAIGLELGVNTRSFLLTRGIAEITRLAVALGAKANTFFGLAGIADLYLTCTSPQSLNREIGIGLGKGRRLEEILPGLAEVPEGINSVRACRARARSLDLNLPIAETTCRILEGEVEPMALEASMTGSALHDIDDGPLG